jgi:hypothetical protein
MTLAGLAIVAEPAVPLGPGDGDATGPIYASGDKNEEG